MWSSRRCSILRHQHRLPAAVALNSVSSSSPPSSRVPCLTAAAGWQRQWFLPLTENRAKGALRWPVRAAGGLPPVSTLGTKGHAHPSPASIVWIGKNCELFCTVRKPYLPKARSKIQLGLIPALCQIFHHFFHIWQKSSVWLSSFVQLDILPNHTPCF